MANEIKGLAPQVQTYAAWVSANPTLGISGYGQIVVATGTEYGDIMVWGAGQTFNVAFAAGQWFQGIGAQSLSPSRKFAEEKTTTLVASTTGWVTILEIPNGNDVPAVSGEVCVMTGTGYVLSCEYTLRLIGSAQSLAKCTLNVKKPGDSNGNFTNVVNFRWAYSESSSTAGAKLQVYVITEQTLYVQMWGNIDRVQTYPGAELVTAVHEDTPLLPDGSTASYLEAGTVLPSLSTSTFRDNRITAYANSTTALHITLLWDDIPKHSAVTITFPVGFTFRQSDGTAIYTVTAADTVTVNAVKNKTVTGIITTTGLTANVSGAAVGANVSATLS